jgi:hypothetical protein
MGLEFHGEFHGTVTLWIVTLWISDEVWQGEALRSEERRRALPLAGLYSDLTSGCPQKYLSLQGRTCGVSPQINGR